MGQPRDGTCYIRNRNLVVGDVEIIRPKSATYTMENLQAVDYSNIKGVGIFALAGSTDYSSGFEV